MADRNLGKAYFRYNPTGLENMEAAIERKKIELAKEGAEFVRKFCPVRSGLLVSTVRQFKNRVYFGNFRTWYWYIIEFGSRPHTIRPRKAKGLWWPGLSAPVDKVEHPGTRPYAPMRRAMLKLRLK